LLGNGFRRRAASTRCGDRRRASGARCAESFRRKGCSRNGHSRRRSDGYPKADDFTVGFEYEEDAQRFLVELRERLARFGLELHPDKTRLIEFGRRAARSRTTRGLGKPETFDFLGFTHICGKSKSGRFWLRRITIQKRMRAKLREVNDQLKRRRHEPVPVLGKWLRSVVQGHLAYYAVPGNTDAVAAFRTQATRHWYKALRRRSQRTRLNWERMNRLANRWLPPARAKHPFPDVRFDARTRGRSPVR
jgi:RNA-directed DNA polymerase